MAGKEKRGQPVWVAGAAPSPSFYGITVARLCTDGVDIFDIGEVREVAYPEPDREVLRAAMGAWPGEARAKDAARIVEAALIAAMADMPEVELLGFRGQTLAHDPAGGRTHQAGDGAALANALGIEVIWDFSSADIGMGGQGTPLAPFFYWACARWIGARGPVAFLGFDDVANLSWIDPSADAPEAPGATLAFDTGPATDLIDGLLARRGLYKTDRQDDLAAQGQIDMSVLQKALEGPWFDAAPPKVLRSDTVPGLLDAVADLEDADAAATLTAVCAGGVARGFVHLPKRPDLVLATGAGRRNGTLMAMLEDALACRVQPVEETGLTSDALDAQSFAYLALRVTRGRPTTGPSTTGVAAPVGGGTRSRPRAQELP